MEIPGCSGRTNNYTRRLMPKGTQSPTLCFLLLILIGINAAAMIWYLLGWFIISSTNLTQIPVLEPLSFVMKTNCSWERRLTSDGKTWRAGWLRLSWVSSSLSWTSAPISTYTQAWRRGGGEERAHSDIALGRLDTVVPKARGAPRPWGVTMT